MNIGEYYKYVFLFLNNNLQFISPYYDVNYYATSNYSMFHAISLKGRVI
jgi:hypothetical protein